VVRGTSVLTHWRAPLRTSSVIPLFQKEIKSVTGTREEVELPLLLVGLLSLLSVEDCSC